MRAKSRFACTSCAACCTRVAGPALESFREWGWIEPDGSCTNLDRETKACKIYEDRPHFCRADEAWDKQLLTAPNFPSRESFYAYVEECCDSVHQAVYGEPRERGEDCSHVEGHLELQIETTPTCQAACSFCVYPSANRAGPPMPMPLYMKIVDEAVTIPQIKSFVLHGLGEPALDRHLVERVRYLRRRTTRSIEVYTNGISMKPTLIDALAEAGLTCLVFSVNAVRPEQHDAIMGTKGRFWDVCANAQYAILKAGLAVECHAVETGDTFTRLDTAKFRARWGSAANVVRLNNWAGDIESPAAFDPNSPCSRALGQVYVMADGRVSMCCLDPTGKTVFGDLRTQSIKDVYNSPAYTSFREDHAQGRAATHPACAGCTRT